jgi:hypothetical protein
LVAEVNLELEFVNESCANAPKEFAIKNPLSRRFLK